MVVKWSSRECLVVVLVGVMIGLLINCSGKFNYVFEYEVILTWNNIKYIKKVVV